MATASTTSNSGNGWQNFLQDSGLASKFQSLFGGGTAAKDPAAGTPLAGLGSPTASTTDRLNTTIPALAAGVADTEAQASQFFGQAGQAYQGVQGILNQLNPIASGDRTAVMTAAAPEVNRVTDQYDAAFKSISTLNPRAGGKVSALTDLRSQEAGAVEDTLTKTQTDAQKTVLSASENLYSTAASLGTSADAQSQQTLGNLISNLFGIQGQNNASNAAAMGGIGSGLGALFGALL